MSTAPSSTELAPPVVRRRRHWATRRETAADAKRAVVDVRHLFAFRASGLRGKARNAVRIGLGVILAITVAAAWLPAYLPNGDNHKFDVLLLLPTALFGILVIAVVSAAATGGGRELLAREQAVAFPVSPWTDHLGALLMAPLNIAWLLQSWTILGSVAYALGTSWLLPLAQLVTLAWLLTATSAAQVIAWGVEWLRRGPRGLWLVRGLSAAIALVVAYLVAAHQLVSLLDSSRLTLWVVTAMIDGHHGHILGWAVRMLALLVLLFVAVVLGAVVASAAAGRPARDELRLESAPYRPRSNPGSELVALLRTDRVGIWRSVPLRRGLFVLGLMPGGVALAGGLQWEMLTILPGLVASGGALLFGVNSWCLDGRGALWRDSLPVSPTMMFTSRVIVLVEVLLFATALTLVFASLRAGVPTGRQVSAIICAALVVVLQVVAASLRWSVRRPFAVDLRSSRATPAPPIVMVGYSSRLALATTLTGMVFAVTAHFEWEWSVLLALPFLFYSAWRLSQTAGAWADPETRCRVVTTVAS